MTAIFFQSIGKPIRAALSSLVRDIVCFTPLAIVLSALAENKSAGLGIEGVLLAAPIADTVAILVIIILTVTFFKKLAKN